MKLFKPFPCLRRLGKDRAHQPIQDGSELRFEARAVRILREPIAKPLGETLPAIDRGVVSRPGNKDLGVLVGVCTPDLYFIDITAELLAAGVAVADAHAAGANRRYACWDGLDHRDRRSVDIELHLADAVMDECQHDPLREGNAVSDGAISSLFGIEIVVGDAVRKNSIIAQENAEGIVGIDQRLDVEGGFHQPDRHLDLDAADLVPRLAGKHAHRCVGEEKPESAR